MKRLVRQSELYTYKFKSPIIINFSDVFSWKAERILLKDAPGYERIIRDAISDSMAELGEKGLAEYISYSYIGLEEDIIKSIIVSVENCEAITTVISNKELDSESLEKVKDYISGQFSDGWGEGFEQQVLDEWEEVTEIEEYDEEEGEYYQSEEEYTTTLSASLWDSNWELVLL